LRADDFEALYAAASDPAIWAQHPDTGRYRPDVFKRFFDGQLASGGALIIIDASSASVIGMSRFHGYDLEVSEVEIGWTFLATAYWGGSYNREIKRLMLEHAFGSVETVIFLVGRDNLRSRRAVEKLGARRAGTRLDGSGRESLSYELRREDWTSS